MNLEDWVKSLGPGRFTCGVKHICFLSDKTRKYVNITSIPEQSIAEDHLQWMTFSDALVDHLNGIIHAQQAPL